MSEVLLNKVVRYLAADLSVVHNRNVFERRLLSKVSINPHYVTTMNDVFVVPIESNHMLDVKTVSQLVCRAVANASSTFVVTPNVFDFSCSYPPPKLLSGAADERPIAMTVAARVSRSKRATMVVQFVARDAEHGNQLCSGQQLFHVTADPLFPPEVLGFGGGGQPSEPEVKPVVNSNAAIFSVNADAIYDDDTLESVDDAVGNDLGPDDDGDAPTETEASERRRPTTTVLRERLRLLPTGEDGEVEDTYVATVKSASSRRQPTHAEGNHSDPSDEFPPAKTRERRKAPTRAENYRPKPETDEWVEFVSDDDDDDEKGF